MGKFSKIIKHHWLLLIFYHYYEFRWVFHSIAILNWSNSICCVIPKCSNSRCCRAYFSFSSIWLNFIISKSTLLLLVPYEYSCTWISICPFSTSENWNHFDYAAWNFAQQMKTTFSSPNRPIYYTIIIILLFASRIFAPKWCENLFDEPKILYTIAKIGNVCGILLWYVGIYIWPSSMNC